MPRKKKQAVEYVLMTQQGYDELQRELEERMGMRDEIAQEIDEARDLGDLSENASYQEAMERKDLNERRISEIEDILSRVKVVEKDDSHVVGIGDQLEIVNTDDKSKKVVQLVGATEADPLKNKISIESPLGKALQNEKMGAEVTVDLPTGKVVYKLKKFVQ